MSDDEKTLDEQEKHEDSDHVNELDDLKNEGECKVWFPAIALIAYATLEY